MAAGAVAGVSHLTKASVLPAVALLALFGSVRGAAEWFSTRDNPEVSDRREATARALPASLLVLLFFFAVIFPYLRVSKQVTGRYFYNVNSTFYMWYESWEEAVAGTRAHGDELGWPDMPPGQIPSPAKYLREHTTQEMVQRLTTGSQDVLDRVLRSRGYLTYLVAYGGALLVAAVVKRRQALAGILRSPHLVLFVVVYFTTYLMLYAWYSPIAFGNRFVLAQAIPALLVLSAGLHALLQTDKIRIGRASIGWLTVVNVVVLGLIAFDAFRAVTHWVYLLRGGG
jgi:hypothetical protein